MASPERLRYCPNCKRMVMPQLVPETGGARPPELIGLSSVRPRCPDCKHVFG